METIFKTKRLILRPLLEEDRKGLSHLFLSPEIASTYMLPEFQAEEEAYPLFERLKGYSESGERFLKGIILDGRIIGMIHEVSRDENSMEIGYFIDPKQWGKGYCSEALQAVIDALLPVYHCLQAGYFEGNLASARVMEKCGMFPIGKTDSILYRGKRRVCHYYEIRG